MKLLFFTLTALLSFGSLKSDAQEIQVSTAVINAFHHSFKNASQVEWKDGGNFYKADFVLNGQHATAFFNTDAKLMAVTKNISPVQLPITLQNNLKTSYDEYWISELFELSDESGTSYYVTVEDGESKITLKSFGNNWSTFKKSRKS
ncbi:MAG: hypothetical protein EOO14_12405 [Chitinophagaceae bacterium]|nr:MAG: hypothetical protein EOO14_12405 [Chitinophagaceae bacterium]